jgi:hypothetical protein
MRISFRRLHDVGKSLRFGMGQAPVMKYHRALM